MENEFLPYEQALALKELGFDELCLYNYSEVYGFIENMNDLKHSDGNNRFVSAPLYQQCFKWFREKYDLFGYVLPSYEENPFSYIISGTPYNINYNTYEEAELECLKKLIEIVKS